VASVKCGGPMVALASSYAAHSSGRSLVQDLKYRFRIKAAQKHELYEASQGVSALSRVTVEDVRNIWLHRLIAETGLPSYRVRIPREIVHDMEAVLKEKMPRDQQGCIQFEDFLPILVYLLRANVTAEDEEEMVTELFEFWTATRREEGLGTEEMRERAARVVREVREAVK